VTTTKASVLNCLLGTFPGNRGPSRHPPSKSSILSMYCYVVVLELVGDNDEISSSMSSLWQGPPQAAPPEWCLRVSLNSF
jgi:hypothetical protein